VRGQSRRFTIAALALAIVLVAVLAASTALRFLSLVTSAPS
jgi:hypothetical protein